MAHLGARCICPNDMRPGSRGWHFAPTAPWAVPQRSQTAYRFEVKFVVPWIAIVVVSEHLVKDCSGSLLRLSFATNTCYRMTTGRASEQHPAPRRAAP